MTGEMRTGCINGLANGGKLEIPPAERPVYYSLVYIYEYCFVHI